MDAEQFESIAINFYQNSTIGDEARSAIMSICHDPASLCLFHTFLFNTHSNEAKFLSLQILSANILYGWGALSDSDRNRIKIEFLNLLFGWCSYIRLQDDFDQNENNLFGVQVQLVHQLDYAIIQILLAEWPQGWPNFLHEFISESNSHIDNADENGEPSFYVLINAVYFMGQLSEQIRSSQYLVSSRKIELAATLSNNFQTIYSFLKQALTVDNFRVQIEVLNTLSFYFQWIDPKIIASDEIIEIILGPIMDNPDCRPDALKCIFSIISRDLVVANAPIEQLFNILIERVSSEITILEDPNLVEIFVDIFTRFVCLDRCGLMPNDTVIEWMIEYTKIVDDELLMEIVAMWHNLIKCYIFDQPLPFSEEYLVPLQEALCSRMCKPVEFGGDASFYSDYSETLYLLFKIHSDDILHIIVDKIDGPQFNTDEMINWIFSVGAVTGICNAKEEAELLTAIFSILLRYITPSEGNDSSQDGSDITMVIASFLYLSGQYTRFLISNRQYFNLFLSKIEECIVDSPPEIQLVALYAFKKVAMNCGKLLIKTEFIQKLFQQFNEIVQQLPAEFHVTLFEASMYVVKNNPDKNQCEEMTMGLFQRAEQIPIITELIGIIDNDAFLPSLESMIHSMFEQFASPETEDPIRKNFYDLFIRFIESFPSTSLLDDFVQLFLNDFGQLVSMISESSNDGNGILLPSSNAKSLSGFSAIIRANNESTKGLIEISEQQAAQNDGNDGNVDEDQQIINPNTNLIPMLFNDVIMPSFDFIKESFDDFPDLRQHFYILINSICDDISLLDEESVSALLDFIFFGLKHAHPYISELSLNSVTSILSQFEKCEDESIVTSFYETFYILLLTNMLSLFFDGLHASLFSQTTHTIAFLLEVAESEKFTSFTQQNMTEIVFKKLQELFPACNEEEIELVSNDIVNSVGNVEKLRSVLTDFAIASKQVQITASPSMDDELVEHSDVPRTPEFEFLNDQNSGNQLIADSYVFPE